MFLYTLVCYGFISKPVSLLAINGQAITHNNKVTFYVFYVAETV